MGGRGLFKMVVALFALIIGAMVLVGDGPEMAMGSDEPAMTTAEMAALESESPETVTKAEENPTILAATQANPAPDVEPELVREASLATATDAAVAAAVADVAASEPEPMIGVIIGRLVNVRSGPSTGAGVVTQVVEDEEVQILGYEDNGWAHILIGGEEGYMSGDFLRELPQG